MREQAYIKSVPARVHGPERRDARYRPTVDFMNNLIEMLTIAVEATDAVAAKDFAFVAEGIDFYEEVERFESQMIEQALRLSAGSQIKAARLLGLSATTLNSKIKNYNIDWKGDVSRD